MTKILKECETLDEVNGVRIIQRKKGYRFSIDPFLLADFITPEGFKKVLDIGTGSGIIAILLARRSPEIRIAGVELQDNLVDLARRNVELSCLSGRVEIIKGDIRNLKKMFEERSFDLIVSNPPYYPSGKGRVGSNLERTMARHEVAVRMSDIIEVSSYLLVEGGKIAVIYPIGRLKEAISEMQKNRIGPARIRKVDTGKGEVALIEGEKGYEGELLEEPPLHL